MWISPTAISATASQKEQDRVADFFKLLYITQAQYTLRGNRLDTVDWRLACDCLDELNFRYADFSFLLSFAVGMSIRNKTAGTGFLRRFAFPFYLGLVGYDCGLRLASNSPATNYWNSVCMLNNSVGRLARSLYSPECFYEVHNAQLGLRSLLTPSVSWVGDSVWFIVQSLALRKVLAYTFEGSCWAHEVGSSTNTALVINCRFFKWKLLDMECVAESEPVVYNIRMRLFPKLGVSRNLRRSYRCKELIMERSTLAGRLWYGVHFSLMRVMDLDKSFP